MDRLRRWIAAGCYLPFEGADVPHVFLELLLGMAIGLVDRPSCFPEVVKLAQLVGDAWQRRADGAPNGVLAVGEHPADRHRQRLLHLAQQGGEILLRRTEETPG
jgi:hypothetical protein